MQHGPVRYGEQRGGQALTLRIRNGQSELILRIRNEIIRVATDRFGCQRSPEDLNARERRRGGRGETFQDLARDLNFAPETRLSIELLV